MKGYENGGEASLLYQTFWSFGTSSEESSSAVKNPIPIIALTLISFVASAQPILQALIDNLPSGKVYLWNTSTANEIDAAIISNFRFEYMAKLTEPTLYYLKVDGFNEWDSPIRMILSNHLTSMTIKELKSSIVGHSFKDVYPNKPEFSIDPNFNKHLLSFESAWIAFSDSIMALSSGPNDDKSLLSRRKALYDKFISSLGKVVRENPDKVVTAVILYEYIIRNGLVQANEAKDLFLQLKDDVRYSSIGVKIGAYLDKEFSVNVGEPAPYFEFKDVNGTQYNLSQFKNKTLLLHFWSSTCGPCRVQNKELASLIDEEIVVINMSTDENEDRWKRAIEKDGLSKMINARDVTGKIRQDYSVRGIPVYYLIDGDGRISGKRVDEVALRTR